MNTESLALDFKSATLYAIRVVLHSADPERLSAALAKRMADAGSFFENEPVVVDASRVEETIDWPALIAALRGHNLPPIGVVAEGANLEAARKAGLTPVELSTPAPRPAQAVDMAPANDVSTPVPSIQAAAVTTAPAPSDIAEPASSGKAAPSPNPMPEREAASATSAPAPTAFAPHSSSALVITKPLRSGQRVYARHTDLVVIGMVSQGAEVIADGNVHVRPAARGHGGRARRCHGPHLHHAPGRRAAGRCRRVSRGRGQARPLAAQPTGAGPTGRRHAAHRGPEGLTQHPIRARAQINYTFCKKPYKGFCFTITRFIRT